MNYKRRAVSICLSILMFLMTFSQLIVYAADLGSEFIIISCGAKSNNKEFHLDFDRKIDIPLQSIPFEEYVQYSVDDGSYQDLTLEDYVFVNNNRMDIFLKNPLEGKKVKFKIESFSIIDEYNSYNTNEIISPEIDLSQIGEIKNLPSALSLYENETIFLEIETTEYAATSDIKWELESGEEDKLIIIPNGFVCQVIAKRTGMYTVSVYDIRNPKSKKTCNITVKAHDEKAVSIQSMTLDDNRIEMKVGNVRRLIPRVYPEEANIKNIVYYVEDPAIISVINNELIAEKKGSTKISVEVTDINDNVFTAECIVSVDEYVSDKPVLSMPVASLPSGTYVGPQSLYLETDNRLNTIYYTTDGSEPNSGSNVYRNAIYIDKDVTIKAIAIRNYSKSDVLVLNYKILPQEDNEIIQPKEDRQDSGRTIKSAVEAVEEIKEIINKLTKDKKKTIAKEIEDALCYTSLGENIVSENVLGEFTKTIFSMEQVQIIVNMPELRTLFGIDESKLSKQVVLTPVDEPQFTDVTEKHWAREPIKRASQMGLVAGLPDGRFAPAAPLKVADTFTFLDRLFVLNQVTEMKLPRTTVEKYITNKEHWAFSSMASIASKLSEETLETISNLGPDGDISRELLCQIIYEITDGKLEPVRDEIAFADIENSPYKEAINYCVRVGLISGVDSCHMAPKKDLTRAELMTILIRLHEKLRQR